MKEMKRVETWVIPEIREKIETLAEQEQRSVQSTVRLLLHEALKWREIKGVEDER